MERKYGLNIVFYMKTYAQFELKEPYEFSTNHLDFKLTELNDITNAYSLIVKPITNIEHATQILKDIKLSLMLFVLEYHWVAFEIDENIKTANIHKEKHYFGDKLVSGDFDIDKTTLFPLNEQLLNVNSHPIPFINYLKIEDLKNNITNSLSLNTEKIVNNEKLLLSLEMYSRLSQFSRKMQFLDLVTILEILKPKYDVSDESMNTIKEIKNGIKTLRTNYSKDSEEYHEFDRYFNDINFWESKSINKSLQLFVKEHENDFEEYSDIDLKIKKAYSIRSNIVHNGLIDEEFDEYYDFLKKFVGKMLKVLIND